MTYQYDKKPKPDYPRWLYVWLGLCVGLFGGFWLALRVLPHFLPKIEHQTLVQPSGGDNE